MTYQQYLEKYKLGKLPFEGKLDGYTKKIKQVSESCGDGLTFYFLVEEGMIKNIGFDGYGCFLSRLSASLLAKKFVGKPINPVRGREGTQRRYGGSTSISTTSNGIKTFSEFSEEKTLKLLGFPVNFAREQCVLMPYKAIHSFYEQQKATQ